MDIYKHDNRQRMLGVALLVMAAAAWLGLPRSAFAQTLLPPSGGGVCGNYIVEPGESCDVGPQSNFCPSPTCPFPHYCVGPEDFEATPQNQCQALCKPGGPPETACPRGFSCDLTVNVGTWSGVCQPDPLHPTPGPAAAQPLPHPPVIWSALYWQPHAAGPYLWDNMDLERAKRDLKKYAATGLNAATIKVAWDFITDVDYITGTFVKDQDKFDMLNTLLQHAADAGLQVILTTEAPYPFPKAPTQAQAIAQMKQMGANCAPNNTSDSVKNGIIPPYCGYLWKGHLMNPIIMNLYFEAYKLIAAATVGTPTSIRWWVDHEHFQLKNPDYVDVNTLASWRNYVSKKYLGNIVTVNATWGGQDYQDFTQPLFPFIKPLQDQMQNTPYGYDYSAYLQEPALPLTDPKFQDFWQWYVDELLGNVLTGFTQAIKDGNPDISIYYEVGTGLGAKFGPYWDPDDQDSYRLEEWLLADSDPNIDFIGRPGYCGNDFAAEVDIVAPYVTKDFVVSEGGCAPTDTESGQLAQVAHMADLISKITDPLDTPRVRSFNNWTFYDTYFKNANTIGDGAGDKGWLRVDGSPKPAHQAVMDALQAQGQKVLACAASNQLADGSFEGAFFQPPVSNAWQTTGAAAVVDEPAAPVNVSGTHAMQLGAQSSNDQIKQTVAVAPAIAAQQDPYVLNVAMRAAAPNTLATVRFRWRDAANALLPNGHCQYAWSLPTTYANTEFTCPTPPTAATLDIIISAANTAYVAEVDLVCEDQ